MSLPKVSVVVPNYNYEKYIAKTIESVLAQTYRNIELIVVDDGSKDNSLNILKRFGDKVTVIEQKNQGVSLARNNGVSISNGDYIAFLDADDIWLPEKLERQMQRLLSDNQVGLVHCSMSLIGLNDAICGENSQGMEGRVADELLRFESGVVIGAGSTAVVPKRVFDEIGGFDRRQTTAADWDLSYRIASKYKVAFVKEPLVLYRLHGSNMHGNIKAMEHDMMLGYEKAFANGAIANRRECYGNLHKSLSGSYFYAGEYFAFARQFLKSIWNKPSNFGYFAQFPMRQFRKNN